ncbi:HTH-type transcriptional regulator CdhR [Actinomadura rubteroloni]|uniref:HTH-type transcriptional regulator CdhR n=1 Tax=Actinomadura rubteroloni TaxID=1926885 RepID=A0A2P4UKE2_9ACTN|nr:helix-turn-helix domain-containing protein [Actinomadura rubteroloni]POM25486.1 HTH-type transcriptional regulator CdhR [Actinomadura rubteroloni]
MHRVAVLVVPPVVPFDVAIPAQVLGEASRDGRPLYDVLHCTATPGPVETSVGYRLDIPHGLDILDTADTIIVPGTQRRGLLDPSIAAALLRAAASGRRLVSICTGAFVLAAAGLLDGRPATTYWRRADEFASLYPSVRLDPSVLFVDDGDILTSAGLAAGIDLCLHLLRGDHGAAVANESARRVVVAPVRSGGQAQFIPSAPVTGRTLADVQAWALTHLSDPLTIADLAAHARVSERTLTRRFRTETGQSPLQWLLARRVDRARELLETTDLPIEEIARTSGLGSGDSLRARFARHLGITPTAYRATFTHQTTPHPTT